MRLQLNGIIFLAIACLSIPAWGMNFDAQDTQDVVTAYRLPLIVIPQVEQPPVIDGNLKPEEWSHAAQVTGFHTQVSYMGGRGLMNEDDATCGWPMTKQRFMWLCRLNGRLTQGCQKQITILRKRKVKDRLGSMTHLSCCSSLPT